ncbi:uncharacterized protein ACNS7B_000268 [Menidia menidia]
MHTSIRLVQDVCRTAGMTRADFSCPNKACQLATLQTPSSVCMNSGRRLQDAEIRPAKWGRSQDFLLKSTETQDYLTQLQHAEMGPAPTLTSIRNRIRSGQGLKTLLNLLQQMLTSTGAADQV